MFQRLLIRLFTACGRRPVTTLVVLALVAVASAGSLRFLRFSDLFDSFFSGASDDWGAYNELTHTFVTDQIVAIGLEAPGELFTPQNLGLVRELSRRLKPLPSVQSVTDVTSVKYFQEGTDSFSSVPLLPDPLPKTPQELDRLKQRALAEPLYVGGILSKDGRTAAIHVRISASATAPERTELIAEVERLVTATGRAHPDWRIAITGEPWFTYYHQIYMRRDLAALTPLTMVLLFAVMLVVMRRLAGPLLALIGSGLFMLVSTALLVVTGGTMNNTTTMVPPFAFIVAVTISIHFFSEYRLNSLRHKERGAALNHTIQELSGPVYYANFSTAIGFLSLAVSNIPAIRQFGYAMALAMVVIVFVLMAYSAAVARLVPAERLTKIDATQSEESLVSVRLLRRLGANVFAHRSAWLVVIALASVVTLYGATRIHIETNMLEMFHERDPLYQDAKFYGSRFGGTSSLYIAIDGAEPDVLTQPAVLRQVEEIEQFLRRELNAGYTVSPADFVKTMHRAFFGGDLSHASIPESQAAVAQLLLMNSDDTVRNVLNEEASRGVVVAWINEHSSAKLLRMRQRLDAFLKGLPDRGVKYRVSGTVILDNELINSVSNSTLQSFALAMGVIFLLRLVQFRHFWLGALSLLPNAFPIWMTFGCMGLLGIPLNVSTAISATVTLGIADDETIHFFAGYQARRMEGRTAREAILETLTDKGSGILFSTIIVTIGFSTLMFSNYGPTMWFGVVLSISFLFSIFANLVFGPALLNLARPLKPNAAEAANQARAISPGGA